MLKREELKVGGRYIDIGGYEVEINAIGIVNVLCMRVETSREYAWNIETAMETWRVAPPPKLKGKKFMNIIEFPSNSILGQTFQTREKADSSAKRLPSSIKRLACIEVDWTEGEGL